jgi:hypothetical protein
MLVRATANFAIDWQGIPTTIIRSDIYDEADPLVVAYPDNFEPVRVTAGAFVEQATANPGEARNTRRGR